MTMQTRCRWLNLSNAAYVKYHDEEWGRPLFDDQNLYELLILRELRPRCLTQFPGI